MSWKQYGGIKNLDSYNNISVNNIIADKFTVRDKFLTEFQIIGDTQLLGNVILGDNSSNLIELKSNLIADENINVRGDLNVNGKLIISSSGEGFFLQGTDDNRLGINVDNPLAVLDIAGSYESVLNVYSDQSNNRNIIARNYLQNGIAVNVTDDDSSSLQFYSGTDISNNKEFPDSEIKYLNGGILEIITGQDTRILSQVSISVDGSKGHIHNETMVVYDISNGTYKNLYYKEDSVYKGNAFSLIAYDSSANTSMNITTPDGKGAIISGGAYPKDTARSMLIMDVSNNSEEKPQALMIVSGQNTEKYNTTTSINKYISQVDQYSLDINGATYISDSQINIQEERNMQFLKVATYGGHSLASGSYDTDTKRLDVYESDDGGVSWDTVNSIFSTNTAVEVNDIFMNNRVRCIITEDTTVAMYVSTNVNPNGNGVFGNYESLNLGINSIIDTIPCNSIYSFFYDENNHFITARDVQLDIFISDSNGNTSIPKDIGFIINDVKGFDNTIYAVGTSGNIKSYTVNANMNGTIYTNPTNIFIERTDASYNVHSNKTYKKVFVYDSNNIITIGDGIITYTHDGGLTWNNETSVISGVVLNDIHIKSENEAIIVGDNGKIFVSHDRYKTWTQLNKDYINGGGTSEYLIGDISNNITSITMTNDNNILTTHALTEDTGRLLLTYAPSVLNRDNMSTLDVIGSLNVSGDLVLHDRGELKTTDISFGLLKTNTRQIDFGLSGELITIGAETGLVDMKGRLQVAMDVSLNSNLDVQGETVLQGFLDVNNSAHINNELTVDGSLNVTEIYGLNNETITISRPTGLVDMKGRLQVTDDVSLNSNLDVQGETVLQGFLDVNNSAHINNELTVDGSLNVTEIYGLNNETITMSRPTGLVDMKGRLQVSDDVSFNSKVHISDDALLYSNLDVGGNALITGSLTVDGNLNFRGNLSQTDISHNVLISDQLTVHNIADDEVALIVRQDDSNTSIAEFKKGESIKVEIKNNGDISMNSVLKIMNNTTSNNNPNGTAGALYVKGGTRLDGSLNVMSGGYFGGPVTFNEGSRSIGETIYTKVTITSDQLDDTEFEYNGIPLDTDKTSKFNVNGGANFNDSINVSNIIYGNKINMTGDASFNSNAFINSNLYLEGDASFNSKLFIDGDISANSNLFLGGDTSLNSKLFIGGDISANSNIYLGGDASLNSKLFIGGDISANSNLYLGGDASLNSKLFTGGDISANSNLFLGGDASLNSKLFIGGDISANTKLFLGGDASLNSKLFVNGDISANTNFYLGGDASLNSKLFVSGETKLGTVNNIGVPLYVDGSGAMRIPVGSTDNRPTPESGQIRFNTTDDTFEGYDGSNWGSLGGVSNPDKTTQVYVGDTNEIVFKTDGKIRQTIHQTTGDVSMNTNLFLGGDASLNSNLYLGGDVSLNSKLFVNGDISANTNLYLGGDASLNSKLFVSGETKLGTVNNTGVPLYVDGSGAMRIPVGSTDNRPTPESGQMRFNTTDDTFEGYDGSNWGSLGGVSNADKSSRIYISDASAIVFETDSIIRETIDNLGNVSFDVANNQGYGKINMKQNSTATILQVSDSLNNNHVSIQNQGAFKLIYDQSGNENNRIQMYNNEIELLPRYPTSSMLVNHNGALIGDDYELLQQLRDKDWNQIGYKNATGTKMGNTVSISRDGKRIAAGEYAVNSTDASSNVHIYNVFEREIDHLVTIKIREGNVSSIDLNEDGTRIIIGQHNAGTNGQIQYYEENPDSSYNQTGVLQSGSTSGSKLGHTTSINNDGTIFAVGQYKNNSNGKDGIEGGVLIFNRVSSSSIEKIADISMNNGGTDDQYEQMGRSIELNGAGDRIVIGGTIDKTDSPVYRVYVYQKQTDNSWDQVLDITNPTSIGINFGLSVAMSNDGKVISIATQEDLDSVEHGQVLVYDLSGTGLSSDLTSSLRGSPITFDGINDGDTFGASMSLNDDGSVLAIGSGALDNFNGKAFIYKYLNSDWTILKTIPGTTTNSNLGGIHDYDMESGQLISDEDGICIDGTGDLVIIGAPNLFTADGIYGSGNGQVYLYRNQTYTLGVNKKLRVKGDVVVDNGTLDVSGNIIVNGSGINKIISDNYGIGNLIKSSNVGGRNSLEGAHNYIYSNINSGQNRLYCTGTGSGNVLSAQVSGGYNLIQAGSWNALTIGGVDKLKTTSSTTTLNNTTTSIQSGGTEKIKVENATTTLASNDVVINKSGDCNLTIHSTSGSIPSLYFIRNSATYGADDKVDYRLYDNFGDFKIDSAYTGGIIRNWITLPSILGDTQRMKLGDNSIAYDGLDLFCGTGTAKLKLEGTTTQLTNDTINMMGNVGIGTTDPSSKLHVDGSITTLGGDSFDNLLDPTGVWKNNNVGTTKPYFQIHNTGYLNYPGFDYSFFVRCEGQNNTFGYVYKTINLRGGSWYTVSGARKIVGRSDAESRNRFYIKVQDITNNIELLSANPFNDLDVWFDFQYSFYISNDVTVEVRLGTIYDIGTVIAPNLCLNKGGIGARKIHKSLDIYQDLIIDPNDYTVGVAAAAADFKSIHDVDFNVQGGGTLYIESGSGYLRLDVSGGTGVNPSMWLEIIPYAGIFKLPIGWVGIIQTTGNMSKTSNQTVYNAVYIHTSSDNVTWTERAIEYIYGSPSGQKEFNLSWYNSTAITEELYVKLVYKAYSVGAGTNIRVRDIKISRIRTIDVVGYEPSKLIVKFNGNVGIGTTDPGAKLDVSGNIKATSLNCSKIINPFDSSKLATDFIRNSNTLTTGNWYSIATAPYSYPSWGATFIITVNESGDHQYLEFKASHQYGSDFTLTVLNNSTFSGNLPITAVRFTQTSDDMYGETTIDIKIGTSTGSVIGVNGCSVYMTNNFNYGLYLADFATPPSSTVRLYEKDLTGCIFSVGRDGNLDMIDVKNSTTTLTNTKINMIGNVGIGTTNPDCLLHVADTSENASAINVPNGIRASSVIDTASNNVKLHALDNINNRNATTASINALRIYSYVGQNANGAGCKSEMLMGTRCDGNGNIRESRGFISYDNNFTIYKHISPDNSNNTTSKIGAATAETHPRIGTTGTETPTTILTCDDDGNVGIGTTDPGEKLEVNGNVRVSGGALYVGKDTDSTIKFSDGTYADRLFIKLNNNNETIIHNSASGTKMQFYNSSGNYEFDLHNFATLTNYNALTIKGSNGNVGIGTTDPQAKLEVNGSAIFRENASIGNNPTIIAHKDEGNWLSIYHDSNTGSIGSKAPNPEGGILFSSPSSVEKLVWNHYIGVVKYAATSVSSDSLRMDFGIATNINSQTVTTASNSSYTPHMTVHYNGNVGIGTTDPSEKLDVNGNVNIAGDLTYNTHLKSTSDTQRLYTSGSTTNWVQFKTSGSTGSDILDINAETGSSTISTRYDNDLLLNPSDGGNVGIGTTDPGAKLDVSGSAIFRENVSINKIQNTDAFTNPHLKLKNIGNINNSGRAAIAMATSDADNYGVSLSANRYSTDAKPKFDLRLHMGTASGDSKMDVGIDTTTLTNTKINMIGNVGIGTTDPQAKLEVNGSAIFRENASIGNNPNIIAHKDEGNWLSIYHDSNTGYIGSKAPNPEGGILFSSPSSVEELVWNHYIGVVKYAATTSPSDSLRMDFGIATNINSQTVTTASDSSYTPHMTVHNNGNVGIGTTDPGEKLDVNGTVKATGLNISAGSSHIIGNFRLHDSYFQTNRDFKLAKWGDTKTHLTVKYDTGYVGIGTTDPQAKLDVNGDLNVVGDIDYDGVLKKGGYRVPTFQIYGNLSDTGTSRNSGEISWVGDLSNGNKTSRWMLPFNVFPISGTVAWDADTNPLITGLFAHLGIYNLSTSGELYAKASVSMGGSGGNSSAWFEFNSAIEIPQGIRMFCKVVFTTSSAWTETPSTTVNNEMRWGFYFAQ